VNSCDVESTCLLAPAGETAGGAGIIRYAQWDDQPMMKFLTGYMPALPVHL
jgi:hypothetical protein